jgi:hypothetical protein
LRVVRVGLSVALFVALALVAIWAVLWPLTNLLAVHDVGAVSGSARAMRLQSAYEAVRTQLLTLGAGLFTAGALVYTARNFALSRQGQVTDRYTKAIEQLGSDKIDVRIGGIFALERIAADSARDHPTVMEVLAAFIREHSREQWPLPASDDAPAPERFTRPDVQAALRVIGRRKVANDGWWHIDLTNAVLPGALLFHTNMTQVRLVNTDLTRANLIEASLAQANLTGADLTEANLTGADLSGARRSKEDPVPDGWLRDPGTGTLRRSGQAAGNAVI